MTEGKGKGEQKSKRGGRRKNAFGTGGSYIPDEVRKFNREQSGQFQSLKGEKSRG